MAKKHPAKKIVRISKFSFFLAVLLLAVFLFLPGQNIYEESFASQRPPFVEMAAALPTPAPYPVNVTGNLPADLTAQGIFVIDMPSAVILYQKNPQMQLSPASTTKLMTALVALETYKMDDILTVKTFLGDGRVMGITPGEHFTAENLLYGTLVHSANDAAISLAENFPGGKEKFIEAMNKKALELNLINTHFANPVGFEETGHYSSAQDLARLAIVALANPTLAKMVGTPAITVADTSFSKFYKLENVNALLGKIPGVLGVKTGWTENAGECLITAVKKNGREVLIVVLGSKDRFGETEKLIDWTFANFTWQAMRPPRPD